MKKKMKTTSEMRWDKLLLIFGIRKKFCQDGLISGEAEFNPQFLLTEQKVFLFCGPEMPKSPMDEIFYGTRNLGLKKGSEDASVLFCEKCKKYRFLLTPKTEEWTCPVCGKKNRKTKGIMSYNGVAVPSEGLGEVVSFIREL